MPPVKPLGLPTPGEALPGRAAPMPVPARHLLHGRSLVEVPTGCRVLLVGMGCFWGAERRYWSQPGVWTTAVGYAGGHTPNPSYREVCSGRTGHAEVVRVVWDPRLTRLDALLKVFWEAHDPTQYMRQGNDVGTQYRSALYLADERELELARASRAVYADALRAAGLGEIRTELRARVPFYFAEPEHQQYLIRHPDGYCGLRGTGVVCPVP